ncbi:uncharacterized protein BDV17DRAFT_289609 [Aspergillus undulatus]|uniref:uncharacterized protein n=1 Tax=Aspergillus undulatus TaxID=1810928 RepID=UPI003CCCB2E8
MSSSPATTATTKHPYDIPAVLAVQNVQAAYYFEWHISWDIYAVDSDSNRNRSSLCGSHSSRNSTTTSVIPRRNYFPFHFEAAAIVPMPSGYARGLRPGEYRLEWEHATSPCISRGETGAYDATRTPVASGTHYFLIVDDDSGLDYEIPLDECPIYGDAWVAAHSRDCPPAEINNSDNVVERDPCAARLKSQGQAACIWGYVRARSDRAPESCEAAFQRADPDWSKYIQEDTDGQTDDPDLGEPDDSTTVGDEEDGAVPYQPELAMGRDDVL